ncbi:LysR family transcriptional regulator [Protofrankia coriariae]|uniref:LysR family transcriptional regulator n=1 Tax=Protofrankia coriariae TaxID=1562887 RepID=UPI0006408BFB|nr:LysR family transcriptional regulator [Protofrankia coriariae]
MNLEIRHARVVAMIAESGSISKAAAKLALPQPSLTYQLRRIEKAIGGDLFVRSSFGITPTPLGERLIPMLVDLANRADAVMAEASSPPSEVLRIGNAEWTPVTLRDALRASLPELDVQTVTMDPAAGMAAVISGGLSVALVPWLEGITPGTLLEPGLTMEIIAREPVWVALPRGHRLAGQPVLTESSLSDLNWVRRVRGNWFHPVEEYLFGRFDQKIPNVLHYVGGHAEAMAWVRDANAVALTPPTGATDEVALVGVSSVPRSQLLLVWRKGSLHLNTVSVLVNTLREYYCEYARTIPQVWAWMIEHPAESPELADYLTGPGLTVAS